jgi:lysophospholipase L1-like esterase
MTRRWAFALSALSVLSLTACEEDFVDRVGVDGTDAFQNYVSIGTSISMGVQSAGVYYAGQTNSWPSLVADAAFGDFDLPLIEAPGCGAPLIAPLQFFRRLDASSAAAPNTVCADNMTGVTLPENNVAIDGATTYQALNVTPADVATGRPLYSRVLPNDQSQVDAMLAQEPTFVTVELGANEVLRAAAGGILIPAPGYHPDSGALATVEVAPGVTVQGTFAPFEVWAPVYDEVIDAVVSTGARAMLVTVPQVASIVSLRSGAELWADRLGLQGRGVILNADCGPGGAGENNLVFVPLKIVNAIGAAAATGAPQNVSCANVPGTQDNVLSATEQAQLTAVIQAMNDHIVELAAANDFALFDGNEVLGYIVENKPAFSAATLVGCSFAFGQFISLDGVHPNTEGHRLIAFGSADGAVAGATDVINEHYGFSLEQHDVTLRDAATLCN